MKSTTQTNLFFVVVGVVLVIVSSAGNIGVLACENLAEFVFSRPDMTTNAALLPYAVAQEPEFYGGASVSNASFTVFLPNGMYDDIVFSILSCICCLIYLGEENQKSISTHFGSMP